MNKTENRKKTPNKTRLITKSQTNRQMFNGLEIEGEKIKKYEAHRETQGPEPEEIEKKESELREKRVKRKRKKTKYQNKRAKVSMRLNTVK